MPVDLAVEGAHRHEFTMAQESIKRIPIARPEPTPDKPQGMYRDKGYDDDSVGALLTELGCTAHLRARGEAATALKQEAGSGPSGGSWRGRTVGGVASGAC